MSRNTTVRGGRARLTAAAATAAGHPAPKWHIVASVTAGAGAFTAVVATGKATALQHP
jgi:hypothetical protein